jgi:hypothetical protein
MMMIQILKWTQNQSAGVSFIFLFSFCCFLSSEMSLKAAREGVLEKVNWTAESKEEDRDAGIQGRQGGV